MDAIQQTAIQGQISGGKPESPAQAAAIEKSPEDRYAGEKETDKRGLILLQIDGLSHRALKEAFKEGSAPNIKSLIDLKGYALSPFQCGIPTVTIPVLSSLFYGVDLPGNEWFDKASGQFIDGTAYETKLRAELHAQGKEGILKNGVAVSSELSGGSENTCLVNNRLKEGKSEHGAFRTAVKEAWKTARLIKQGGYSLTKTAWNFVSDIFKARAMMKKAGISRTKLDKLAPIMMSLNHNICERVACGAFLNAIKRGEPVMYTDFAAYDEKAHYFGKTSKESMDMLRTIDEKIGRIVAEAEKSPNKYEVLVFSDHGQTSSKLFQDLYGTKVHDMVESFAKFTKESRGEGYNKGDVVVTDVYSLGNVYFNFDKGHVAMSEVEKRYPGMTAFLNDHPGIGLVCGRENGNIIVKGKQGTLEIDEKKNVKTTGESPLKSYGDEKVLVDQITSYMSLKGSGDIVIFGAYDQNSDEVVDFNKKYSLVSLHGGLGGDQTKPFIIAKPEVPINGGEITEATQLHEVHEKYKDYLRG